ncbi:MAG: recombinase family protein [Gallionellaceae bacterium]
MAKIGYARVSSTGQSLEVQLEKLKGCEKIYREKKSAKTDNRPQLQICLDYVRHGDTLVITKLDRLARSTRDLLNITNKLSAKKVQLKVLDQNIDTSTPTGKLMLTMLGAIAEFENDLRKERQADGIEMAKKKGVQFGRKPSLTAEQIQEMKELRDSGIMIKDLMSKYSLSKASIYRLLPNG